jgi:hypothetical protein
MVATFVLGGFLPQIPQRLFLTSGAVNASPNRSGAPDHEIDSWKGGKVVERRIRNEV